MRVGNFTYAHKIESIKVDAKSANKDSYENECLSFHHLFAFPKDPALGKLTAITCKNTEQNTGNKM